MMRLSRTGLWLAAILGLEIAVYSPSFGKFFCGDSLFYFSRTLEDGNDLIRRFTTLDDLDQYRPLTYVFFTYGVYPFAGLSLIGNHIFPLLFHGLNTLLVYFLGMRLLAERWQSLLSAFFFGVSTVGGYITYDNTFIPDYLYVFFYLSALLALLRAFEKRFRLRFVIAIVLFLLALSTKEATVTFPAAALIVLALNRRTTDMGLTWKKIVETCSVFTLLILFYLSWHLSMKDGSLYPTDPNQPYHLEIGWDNLRSRLPALRQVLNLPATVSLNHSEWPNVLVLGSLTPLLVVAFCYTLRGVGRGDLLYSGGILWFVATLAPALLVAARPWEHNLYLPLLGLSWILVRSFAETRIVTEKLSRPGLVPMLLGYVIVTVTWATLANGAVIRRSSWMARGSEVAQNSLADIQGLQPPIQPNTLLYVEPTREKIAWYLDGGRLPATLYRDPSIRMRFLTDGQPGPSERLLRTGKIYLLKYINGRLYDVTQHRRLESLDVWSYRILDQWTKGTIEHLGEEHSAQKPAAGPVPDALVFPFDLGLKNDGRESLVVVPGVTYSHALPALRPGSRLEFGVALASLRGDGLVAEIRLRRSEEESILFSRELLTSVQPSEHAWDDHMVDLEHVQGHGYTLQLAARSLPGGSKAANWLAWSRLKIVPPEAQNLALPATTPPAQPSGIQFIPSEIRRGEVVTVKVIGGEEMEVDCEYSVDASKPKTLLTWLTTNSEGQQTLKVETPGRYVISAIRNTLRSDWVRVYYEWRCLP